MKLFLTFLLFNLFVGVYIWDKNPIWRHVLLGVVGLGVCFAYLALEQI